MKRILGLDHGERRIGLALSDPLQIIAKPFETIDLKLNEFDSLNFHPLINTATINIKKNDFYNFLKIQNINISLFNFETYNTCDIK